MVRHRDSNGSTSGAGEYRAACDAEHGVPPIQTKVLNLVLEMEILVEHTRENKKHSWQKLEMKKERSSLSIAMSDTETDGYEKEQKCKARFG